MLQLEKVGEAVVPARAMSMDEVKQYANLTSASQTGSDSASWEGMLRFCISFRFLLLSTDLNPEILHKAAGKNHVGRAFKNSAA